MHTSLLVKGQEDQLKGGNFSQEAEFFGIALQCEHNNILKDLGNPMEIFSKFKMVFQVAVNSKNISRELEICS